jgi:formate hydrogenlyase subunit 3/multisubunit Na+/H+ antiporter MnhD subunit
VDRETERIIAFATLMNMLRAFKRAFARLISDDEGDVPGWVLITLMTAGLVIIIWALAGPALSQLFEQAIARVSGI